MRKLLFLLVLLAGAVTATHAQMIGPWMQFRTTAPAADEECGAGSPTIFEMSTRKFCICTDSHYVCENTSLDTFIIGATNRDAGVCVTATEIAGHTAISLLPCASDTSLPGLLVPPKYYEANKPTCDAALEGVSIYLFPEVGTIAGRTVTCAARMDGSAYDWMLSTLGN